MFATLPAAFGKMVRVPQLEPDARVFAFIFAASFAAMLIFGLIPAIQTTHSNLVQANRGDFGNELRTMRGTIVNSTFRLAQAVLRFSRLLEQ